MPRHNSRSARGGFLHIMAASVILGGVFVMSQDGGALHDAIFGEKAPERVATLNVGMQQCAANTVDTIIGTLGCGSAQKGAHLSGVTFMKATK